MPLFIDWIDDKKKSTYVLTALLLACYAALIALTVEDRSRLVDLLLESLHESPSNEVEAAWAVEIERRLAAYDSGEIQSVAGEDVFAKARSLAR